MIEKITLLIILSAMKAKMGEISIPNLCVGTMSRKGFSIGSVILYKTDMMA